MLLKFDHKINGDVYSTKITVDAYGTDQMDGTMEKDLLSRHPIVITTKDLEFMSWIRRSGNTPIISSPSDFGADALMTIPYVAQQEWLLGDTFEASYEISLKDIPASDLSAIVTSREFAAQAYCMIFDHVVKKAIESAMKELRAKHRPFEDTQYEVV